MVNREDKSKVISLLHQNISLKEIARQSKLNLAQIKQIKTIYEFSMYLQEHAHKKIVSNFDLLDTKGLLLSKYFAEKDLDALNHILAHVSAETTIIQLQQLIDAYEEWKARIESVQKHYEHIKAGEAEFKKAQHQQLNELELRRRRIVEQYKLFEVYEPAVQALLRDYLSPYKDLYILKKRFDSGFRRVLEKKEIIAMNENYLYEVKSLSALADQLSYRLKGGFHIHWNYEREIKKNPLGNVKEDPAYIQAKLHQDSEEEITRKMAEIEKSIHTYDQQIESLQAEIKRLQTEPLIDKSRLAEEDQVKQMQKSTIQRDLIRWYIEKGYVATGDVLLPNGAVADVLAYNEQLVIIVCITLEDKEYESVRANYLPYTDEFYFYIDYNLSKIGECMYLRKEKGEIVKLVGPSIAIHEREISD